MNNTQHIASLDGLRGVAAIVVVVSHIGLVFPSLHQLTFADIGSTAVALFFALSGFLMAYLYSGHPPTRKDAADFLVSRLARIYPAYLLAIVVAAILSAIPGLDYVHPISGPVEIARHVLMLGSSGVLWSIPPEIQFYMLFPLVWLCLARPLAHANILAAIGATLAVAALLGFPGPGILLTSKLHFFLFGAIAGRLHQYVPKQSAGPVIGVLALALPVVILIYRQWFSLESPWGMAPAFAAALIVWLVAMEHPISARLFAAAPLRFAGNISFSLYLLHVPVLFLTYRILDGMLPVTVILALGLCLAFVVAYGSYRLVEVPSRRALRSLWQRYGATAARVETAGQAPAISPLRRTSM
ncbi:acyltransferase [Rhizobium sp. BK251]|uniref:acyltransferase family protein n=1 Tax=Rhizobium sp. BK251 TaxID=2512125 RepID=UPI001042CA5C|nr:acyltransferase [Rhizobium sp. BK251]TCL74816.1 peptidoglycan/LPS O-acetylase OafA/YrhL [Rhizobium sp. BK251]